MKSKAEISWRRNIEDGRAYYSLVSNFRFSGTVSIAPRHLMGMENCKKYSFIDDRSCAWDTIGFNTIKAAKEALVKLVRAKEWAV